VSALESAKQALERKISAHQSVDVEQSRIRQDRLQETAKEITRRIPIVESELQILSRERAEMANDLVSMVWFWHYFSKAQADRRSEVERVDLKIEEVKKRLARERSWLQEARDEWIEVDRKLRDFHAFDLNMALSELEPYGPEIARLKTRLDSGRDEILRLESAIAPHVAQYKKLSKEHASLKARIDLARDFVRRLSEAKDGAARGVIHGECERALGVGKPGAFISDNERTLNSLERNRDKIERRIVSELDKAQRRIDHLVIDGKNMCFQESTFIGLKAITAFLAAPIGPIKVTVVFDASIRNDLKAGDDEIRTQLDRKAAVHISPSKTAADEFLLKLASGNPHAFIISNDRFKEYSDFSAVAEGRVLRFLIADKKLMINDLDLTLSFS
jgi:hypothetical protein